MKSILIVLDVMIFVLAIVDCSSLTKGNDNRLSLVHVFRAKRFDLSMFGCPHCNAVVSCSSDKDCIQRKGRQFTCRYTCCAFICVERHSYRAYDVTGSGNNQVEETLDISQEIPEDDSNNTTTDTTTTERPSTPAELIETTRLEDSEDTLQP